MLKLLSKFEKHLDSKKLSKKTGFVPILWHLDDDLQNPKRISSRTRPHDACQGRQARSPGSDVTATADVNSFQQVVPKIRSNLTWHSNMLAVKDLPKNNVRKSKRRPRERAKRENGSRYSFLDKISWNCAILQ